MSAIGTGTLFPGDLPSPAEEQFRLRRLQVFNWGTFSGLHDVAVAERGFLFVGRSGSGKSTLLDAMAALLVPPQAVDFNAAARESERSGRDRSLVSYVRGAWADRHDDASGEVATQYLRKGSTWSALAMEYRDGLGRTVSLVRLLWLSGNTSAAGDVRKHYLVAERPFEIATELEGFDFDLRRLKQRLSDVHHHDSFNAYAERFRRLLGIDNESALKLLHKTQSAKNLGDLNGFLREFMLERPETFEVADRLVDEFAELDGAHRAVVAAREQIETLQPAQEEHRQLLAVRGATARAAHLLAGIDPARDRHGLRLHDEALAALAVEDAGLAEQVRALVERLRTQRADVEAMADRHRQRGGARIEQLEAERRRCESDRDDRIKRRGRAELACSELEWTLADTPRRFVEQLDQARRHLEQGRDRRAELDAALDALRLEKKQAEGDFELLREEIRTLERNPSNIPAPVQALRDRLAGELNMEAGAFPFVGELLQVRAEDADWRGAIERLLHGFGQSLLVDERHYRAVADWVDRTHLRGKLVYYKVGRAEPSARAPDPRSVLSKLERKPEHPFGAWLDGELRRRFDYHCAESLNAFRQAERALTRQGQIRHGGDRHEKDDRRAIDDRRGWLLGFDNRDKLALFKREAAELGARLADLEAKIAEAGQRRERDGNRDRAAQTLADLSWSDIDVAPLLGRIDEIDAELRRLREGDADLRALGEQLAAAREAVDRSQNALTDREGSRKALAERRARLSKDRDACAERLVGAVLDADQERGLSERLSELAPPTLDNIESLFRRIERDIQEEQRRSQQEAARLEHAIVDRFAEFMRRWPQDSGDFQAGLEVADDFFARLDRLRLDGLPRHEQRFFDLLKNQGQQSLLALQTHMSQAHKAIRARMEDVNASLEQVPFNRGSLLRIRVEDLRLQEVVEFRQALAGILGHQHSDDRELAETRFADLRTLVGKLAATDPERRRWRERVLDVRQHVEFIGEELDATDRRQLEVYRSGAGKSGGQRQKLATTCLAAALRYQLGGEDGGLPRYAAVVLDEAFDKADNEFTAMAMTIFENFGFQMIVATPLKSVMTLEPFIGGACFVDIHGRHDSGVLPIEYDEQSRRLALPEHIGGDRALA